MQARVLRVLLFSAFLTGNSNHRHPGQRVQLQVSPLQPSQRAVRVGFTTCNAQHSRPRKTCSSGASSSEAHGHYRGAGAMWTLTVASRPSNSTARFRVPARHRHTRTATRDGDQRRLVRVGGLRRLCARDFRCSYSCQPVTVATIILVMPSGCSFAEKKQRQLFESRLR